jgi:signal transduction histidine kinase
MKYLVKIVIIVLTCFIHMNIVEAQNNPYKIKNDLYNYVMCTQNVLKENVGLKMTDTLFAKAKKAKDLKAQCIALYLKGRHYHLIGNYKASQKQFDKSSAFILHTPYSQYYFCMWNDIITDLINTDQHAKAVSELKAYREEAIKKKNSYAIIESYMMQGNMYSRKQHFRLALPYYKDALDYAIKCKRKDLFGNYLILSRCSFHLTRWKEAEDYADKALDLAITNKDKLIIYSQKLSIYCCSGENNQLKIESDFLKLQEAKNGIANFNNDDILYDEAMYYYYKYYKNDNTKTKEFITGKFIPSALVEMLYKAKYDEAQKDYINSAKNYLAYTELIRGIKVEDENFLYEGFLPQLAYNRLEHEKVLLMEKRAELELKQINDRKALIALNEERDYTNIHIRKHEQEILLSRLEAQKATMEQQDRLLKNEQLKAEQDKKTSKVIEEKNNWQLLFICTFAIAILIMLLIIIVRKQRTHRKLRIKKANAIRSRRLKSLFFQNMNHEIRTPLNAISGFNEILNGEMSEELSTEEKTKLIGMIRTNSELLMTLVNDVLDLSNFEGGTYNIKLADTDINQLCQTAIESIRGKEKEGVELTFDPPSNKHYTLKTDTQRLQQVLTNYLSNACKYTDQGSIRLTYEILPYLIRFSVTDTGNGIKAEDAQKVFNRFQMLDGKKSGTGLGLHICGLIAKLLKGHVYIDTNYTKGAKFIFDHPILTFIITFMIMSISPKEMMAHAHPQHNKNDIYTYYQKIKKENNPNMASYMSDSMFVRARKLKDTKAQCLALAEKMNILITENKQDTATIVFKTCKNLCLKTKNYEIMFDAWENEITHRILINDFTTAMEELRSMHKTALDLNNSHGLTTYFYLAGNYYAIKMEYAAALTYYLQIRDYKIKDPHYLYSMIGKCHYYLRNYQEAIKNIRIALDHADTDSKRLTALVALEKSYSLVGDSDAATRTIRQLENINPKDWTESETANYHAAFYYYYTYIDKNKRKALDEAKWAFGEGSGLYNFDNDEYKKANDLFKEEAKNWDGWLRSDHLPTQELYISKFDFQRAEKEKDELAISNINIKIIEAKSKQKLMALQHEKTLLMLRQETILSKQKKWQLTLQNIQLMKRKSELEKQKILNEAIAKQKYAMQQKAKWKLSAISFVIILIFSGISSYIIDLKRKESHLRREALAAQEEENEKAIFFDNMNKEIRRPLDTIINLNNKLNGNLYVSISHEERIEMVRQLNLSSSYLTKFVNDVLDISKMESGTWNAEYVDCEINEMCNYAISAMEQQDEIGCEILFMPGYIINPHPQELHFISDKNLIHVVLTGFLHNAIRCSRNESVILAYTFNDSTISFFVDYLSEKITEEQAHDIFYFEKNKLFEKKDAMNFYKIRLIADILHAKASVKSTDDNRILNVFELPRYS